MSEGEGWWLGYCYTINSIIGAGILAIPWAYSQCGWILGICIQMIILYLSFTASYLMLSTWSRVESIAQLIEAGAKIELVPTTRLFQRKKKNSTLLSHENTSIHGEIIIANKVPEIGERKFDLYEMVHMTLGKKWSNVVILALLLSDYPILVAYLAVFSKSLTSNIPLFGYTCNLYDEPEYFGRCRIVYWCYLSIFSTIMIILSCFKVHEHKWMQAILSLFRFIVFFIMLVTSIYANASNTSLESSQSTNANPVKAELSNFSSIFFIIVFASLFENLIPTTTSFVKEKAKNLPKVINLSCISFNLLYITIGMVLSFSIEKPAEMVSLNWRHYSAGYNSDERPAWTYLVAYIVILLPAMDIASSFPIVSGNFADNVMCTIYGHQRAHEVNKVFFI